MKKTMKKWLTSLATVAMIVSAAPIASAAELEPAIEVNYAFNDVPSRYSEAVSFFYDFDIIKGTSTTEFGTYTNLKRGDAAVILANTLGLDTANAPDAGFTDLNDRVKGAVNALAAEGIVSGYTATTFEPDKQLSRGAMAKILTLGFDLESYATETPFTDESGVFQPYIQALYGAGITTGKTETTYGTYANIVRGDFANLLYNTIMYDYLNIPTAAEARFIDSNTLSVTLEEPVGDDMTVEEAAYYLYIGYTLDEIEYTMLDAQNPVLSSDRLTLTFDINDLTGMSGLLYVDSIELSFNY